MMKPVFTEYEVICGRRADTFRVHDEYFKQKSRFSRTGCPTCGGPLQVVTPGTDEVVKGVRIDTATGRIVKIGGAG